MNKILIIEDEYSLALDIQNFLNTEGYNFIDIATNEIDGYHKALNKDIDLIILDINLKNNIQDISGIQLAEEIIISKDLPIIFLTGIDKKHIIDKTLHIRNSYFLTKPYREFELLRIVKQTLNKVIKLDNDFIFDYQKNALLKNKQLVKLNYQQLKLLKLFIANQNIILTHEFIEQYIWGDKILSKTTKTALISKLRRKLDNKFIKSYNKLGYLFKIT